MTREPRELFPWERRVGCPKCKARPRERCVTTRPIHMPPWSERDLRYVGRPTSAHKARYKLWCWLWAQKACEVNR